MNHQDRLIELGAAHGFTFAPDKGVGGDRRRADDALLLGNLGADVKENPFVSMWRRGDDGWNQVVRLTRTQNPDLLLVCVYLRGPDFEAGRVVLPVDSWDDAAEQFASTVVPVFDAGAQDGEPMLGPLFSRSLDLLQELICASLQAVAH